ncbi:hypothetical protein A9R00_02035 [Oleispira antarctica]|uniref:Glycosyltransferase 2-like domain-containing protein n=1 Tax=Oleispira antarctica TaxID=188908 RepID=A0A1Y5HVV2_OLEAN|nr:hypothetical protein A9R00_02035 [Oleispira antarctica]
MLNLAGVPFAIEKMGGNIYNPDGHFEDMTAMRMHDEFLSEAGTNWKYHDECEISHDTSISDKIKSYSDCRDRLDGPLWLMKDPRATLFLDDWQSALGGNGKFVLLYRHWGLCIQSLLKRHSQYLAHDLPTGRAMAEHIAFWQYPELAARMWLAYNKAMIKFIRANQEKCLVVSQASLLQGSDLIAAINNKFGGQLKPLIASPVHPQYASKSVDAVVLKGLSAQLQSELDITYKQLAQLCDTDNAEDFPKIIENPRDEKTFSLVLARIKSSRGLNNKEDKDASSPPFVHLYKDYQKLPFDELLLKLQELKPLDNKDTSKKALSLALRLIELAPFKIAGHEWLGKIYAALGEYKNAEIHFVKAISIGGAPPYMRMLLADTFFARYEFKTAEYFYLLAFKGNDKNPQFSIKLGDLYFILKEYEKSISNYEVALVLNDNERVKEKLINVVEEYKGTEAALVLSAANLIVNNSTELQTKQLSLKLKLRTNDARNSYRKMVKESISREKVSKFLECLAYADLPSSQLQQLTYWLSQNLLSVFSANEVASYFMEQQGDSPSSPRLSVIVISYNMARELPRTITSLLPPYQENISESDVEVIVVDNGSSRLPLLSDFPKNKNLRIIKNQQSGVSPVSAINLGLSVAKGNLVGVLIDGARMASPGLYKHVLKANRLSPRTVISTLGFHLGPEVQMTSVPSGYNQAIEDDLLKAIDWCNNGYRLFEISALAGSSANGYFQPIAESNALFMDKALWQELGGYDERFITPGGGFVNLDTYRRACELPDIELAVLLNEGTFHQVHGGVATNLKREDATPKIFSDEYKEIRKKPFSVPNKVPLFLGSYIFEAQPFLSYSIEQQKPNRQLVDVHKNRFNRILLNNSYCNQFETAVDVSDDVLTSPIIITGRGGSGTRLLSQLVQSLDLFLGNDINETKDSIEWVAPIYDLITNRVSLKNKTFKQHHIDRLQANAKNILLQRSFSSGLWGFKLPETMLCLPELLKAFPNAKIIHLVRHPISISLRRSHMTSRINNPVGRTVLSDGYQLLHLDEGTIENRGEYFNNAVSWNYQLKNALDFFENNLSSSNFLQLKYEDMVNDAEEVLSSMCDFLALPKQALPELAIDAQRFNQRHEPSKEVDEIWSICGEVANLLGYTKQNVSEL